MNESRLRLRPMAVGLLCLSALCCERRSPATGSARFVIDGNRVYAELSFVRTNGSARKALAFVDMGSPSMSIEESLFRDLQLDHGKPLIFRVGDMPVRVSQQQITIDRSPPHTLASNRTVEAVLPAEVLRHYQIVIDYRDRTLTFALPGTLRPEGIPVPFRINAATGLIAVDASIASQPYSVTIDNGSAYTWFRQRNVKEWLPAHPDWERGVGAVGPSNMRMAGDGAESSGILLRVPEIRLGSLSLRNVGVLGAGPSAGPPGTGDFFDWYGAKNAEPVIGWIGANVLKAFRLTIDYPNHVIYWLQKDRSDSADLDQVGLTLKTQRGDFIVDRVATKNGQPTIEGVRPGDTLTRIDGWSTQHASWGAVYAALHGKPGDVRVLAIERDGRLLNVRATVTAF
jgi:hypothetical protein